MARKKKKALKNSQAARPARRVTPARGVVCSKVTGVPVAKPASNIQLTPIVQPVTFVPYSTQNQPMMIMEDEYEDYGEY